MESKKDRSLRELREAVEKVKRDTDAAPAAEENASLNDAQARGGAEMATKEGRTETADRAPDARSK